MPGQIDGVFKVRVSDYPALGQPYGSVRLGLNPVTAGSPYPDGDFYPILVNRDDSGNFYVLDCECRHEGCVVPTFSQSDLGIRCQCHGSFYWIDGSVLNGPATEPLFTYPFSFDGQYLTIRISCWGFNVQASPLSAPIGRIGIDFTASTNVRYGVRFTPSIDAPWAVAAFATSPAGPANQTSLTGTGAPVSVYVDRTGARGFFAVEMDLGPV
jgi:nitrite reductase/ring-hydroxylating ferredoxin subunit